MAQKQAAAKTSTINRAPPSPSSGLERYGRGWDGWPRSWMGWEKDLPPGETLVICFRPFLEYLASSGLSTKTIQKHNSPRYSRQYPPRPHLGPWRRWNVSDPPALRQVEARRPWGQSLLR